MAQDSDEQQAPAASRSGLLETLSTLAKRRVFGTAAIYVPSAWLAVEIAARILELVDGDDSSLRLIIALAAGGFPVAIYLAWVFDLTLDGIVRTGGVFRTTPAILVLSGVVLLGSTYGFWQLLAPAAIGIADGPCATLSQDDRYLASVGVLPFRFLSGDNDEANIAEGFTEDVRSLLSKLENFCVPARVARSAVAANRDDLRRISDFLKVSYLLDGTVQVQGDTIKVTAELMNSSSGLLEWSDTYEGDKSSLFEMQGGISRGVVAATHPTVVYDIENVLNQREIGNAESHYLFLLGRHYFYQYGIDSINRAIELYERAVELDDRNPLLDAELAKAYAHNLQVLSPDHWGEMPRKAEAALARALDLNADLAAVQTAVGKLASDPMMRAGAYIRALELDPNSSEALAWLSQSAQGISYERCMLNQDPTLAEQEPDLAIMIQNAPPILFEPLRLAEAAHKLDPYNATIVANLSNYYSEIDRRDDGLALLERSASYMPDSAVTMTWLGNVLQQRGRLVEGLQRLQQAIDLDYQGWRMRFLIAGYLAIDDTESADVWLQAQAQMRSRTYINGHFRFWHALQAGTLNHYLTIVDPDVNPVEQARAMLYTDEAESAIVLLQRMYANDYLGEMDAAWVAVELGWILRQLDREAQARPMLEAVARDGRSHLQCNAHNEFSIYWALNLALLGEWDEANEVLQWLVENAPGLLLQAQHVRGFAILEENDAAWTTVSGALAELEQEKQRWQRIRATEFLQPQ